MKYKIEQLKLRVFSYFNVFLNKIFTLRFNYIYTPIDKQKITTNSIYSLLKMNK